MTKISATAVSALALIAALSGSAYASDLNGGLKDGGTHDADYSPERPWQGPYLGLGVGYRWQGWKQSNLCKTWDHYSGGPELGTVVWKGTEDQCKDQKGSQSFYEGGEEDADSFIVTGRVGYDWQRGAIVFGFFGDVDWLNANTDHFADAKFAFSPGVRLGTPLSSRILAYLNGGVEVVDFNEGLDTKISPFAGGGLEYRLGDGWSLAAEGRFVFDDDDDLPLGVTRDDPISAKLLVLKKF